MHTDTLYNACRYTYITLIPSGLQSSEISSMSKSPYVGVMRAYLARQYLSSSSVLTQEELHAAGVSHYEQKEHCMNECELIHV